VLIRISVSVEVIIDTLTF